MEGITAGRRALLASGALAAVAGCAANPRPVLKDPPTQAPPKAADVPVGGGVILDLQDGIVVTQPSAGVFKAFTAVCTHEGCVVTSVSDGTILCPCHGSKFRIADGSVAEGPAKSPLKAIPVKVSDGIITFT